MYSKTKKGGDMRARGGAAGRRAGLYVRPRLEILEERCLLDARLTLVPSGYSGVAVSAITILTSGGQNVSIGETGITYDSQAGVTGVWLAARASINRYGRSLYYYPGTGTTFTQYGISSFDPFDAMADPDPGTSRVWYSGNNFPEADTAGEGFHNTSGNTTYYPFSPNASFMYGIIDGYGYPVHAVNGTPSNWGAEYDANAIGALYRVNWNGHAAGSRLGEFVLPSGSSYGTNPLNIVLDAAHDRFYYTMSRPDPITGANSVGYFSRTSPTTISAVNVFPVTKNTSPTDIAQDGSEDIWFTESGYTTDNSGNVQNHIGWIQLNADGTPQAPVEIGFSSFGDQTRPMNPNGITRGPDGNMWFTEQAGDRVAVIFTNPASPYYHMMYDWPMPSNAAGGVPVDICSDGTNLWFTDSSGQNFLGKIAGLPVSPHLFHAPLPTSGARPSLPDLAAFLPAGHSDANSGPLPGQSALMPAHPAFADMDRLAADTSLGVDADAGRPKAGGSAADGAHLHATSAAPADSWLNSAESRAVDEIFVQGL